MNKANLELRKNVVTTRSATDWNMLQGELIVSKLQGNVKVNFLPLDQLQIGICCKEK